MPAQLKIFFLAAETEPFIKIGGLADVAGLLPLALRSLPDQATQGVKLDVRYFYHCKKNPEGFRKLMLENMDKMNENEIAEEAELLQGVVVRPVQVQPVQKLVNWHCLEMSTQIITCQCYGSYWL